MPLHGKINFARFFVTGTNHLYHKFTLLKIKDCTIAVGQSRERKKMPFSPCSEWKFVSDCLLKWFDAKYKTVYLEFSNKRKVQYEIENPIHWQIISNRLKITNEITDFICDFPLKINIEGFHISENKLLYMDFYISIEYTPKIAYFRRFLIIWKITVVPGCSQYFFLMLKIQKKY